MKPQPSVCLLSAVAAAGALLLGCEGGIQQLTPGASSDAELIAAYVDPGTSAGPGGTLRGQDGDLLPIIDGDPQDKEWNVAQPLYVYVSGAEAMGGPGFYVEMRAIWTDDSHFGLDVPNHLYMLIRYGDETFDIYPDYWRYATPGGLGLIASPTPKADRPGDCDPVIVRGANWYVENAGGAEDQVALMFEIEPASDGTGNYAERGCQVACHAGNGKQFGAVPQGRLDTWVWRAGRTNVQNETLYGTGPNSLNLETNRQESNYPAAVDPSTAWPAFMEDMVADASGLKEDLTITHWPFMRIDASQGHLYTRNLDTRRAQDGLPIPANITKKVSTARQGTGPSEPQVPVNDNLLAPSYLWGGDADPFTACDSIATTRQGGNTTYRWSEHLELGETDVVPGYMVWIPTGSAHDVRAKGVFESDPTKRFPTWNIEIRRAMITGNSDDAELDPNQEYTFTIAIFDRSAQIHSGSGPLRLKFQPSIRGKAAPPAGRKGA